MSTLPATTEAPKPSSPLTDFARFVERAAARELKNLLGSDAGMKAAAGVAQAFRQAVVHSEKPGDLLRCSEESIGGCVLLSARYRMVPGGPFATVYILPKGGALQWWINHRGLIELARRSGYQVKATPVFHGEEFEFRQEEEIVVRHVPDLDGDGTADRLRGVLVQVYDLKTRKRVDAVWLNKSGIEKRRAKSMQANSGPWRDWYVEQAIKTGIKYAAGRGVILFDAEAQQALASDADAGSVEQAPAAEPVASGRSALGLRPAPALPDHGEPEDIADDPTPAERAAILAAEAREATSDEAGF